MKLKITDWILTGDISPLKWGDSAIDIERLFDYSAKEIRKSKEYELGCILLDFVEFYFEEDNYVNLCEINIKNIACYSNRKTEFFDPVWLHQDLTFEMVSKELTDLQVIWEIERGPHFNTPNIKTKSGVLFCFDPMEKDEIKTELMSIYLRK